MLPNACRSLLAFALVFSISYRTFALADSRIIDDFDSRIQWNGAWTWFHGEPPPTWDGTLAWGNISGSTATFTFTGTSIQVFGAFKPVGVWSMQSQYAIDGGSPTIFAPSQEVSAEAYNQSFYHSGSLTAGEHTLIITNMGVQLWLDYFVVNDDLGAATVSPGGLSTRVSSTTTTATVTPSTTIPSPARSTHDSTSSIATAASISSTSALPTLTQINASVSTHNSSLPPTTSPSSSGDVSPASSPPSVLSPSSSRVTTPGGAEATQGPANGTPHSVPTGLIVGVTIGGLAVLAILLVVWYRYRRHRQSEPTARVAPFSQRPPSQNASGRTETPTSVYHAHDSSLRESQSSATLLVGPRMSRRASSVADFAYSVRRSTDGGVTIAGGPGGDGGGDAPSISDVQSIKSRLPPVYQAYGGRSG